MIGAAVAKAGNTSGGFMRIDNAKATATQKQGAKREQKDLESPRQLKANSKRGHQEKASGQGLVRRREQNH
jgi:hypothetical protein